MIGCETLESTGVCIIKREGRGGMGRGILPFPMDFRSRMMEARHGGFFCRSNQ